MTDATNTALLHELKVHQVELEMQNEALRRAQIELAAARDRYMDLCDFAPVGYFTLDKHGVIVEANLTSSAMVDRERKTLLGRPFAGLLAAPSHQAWRVALTDISERKLAEASQRTADMITEASETERRHVSRELHEELGQRLSALKMALARHRHINRIDIALQSKSGNLALSVQGSSNWPAPPTGQIKRNDMTQSLTERTRMLQGRLQLEQTRSGGLRFAVTLPIQSLQQRPQPSTSEASHATRRL